nr:IS3 family transposase [Christensenella timonensis]
MEEMSEEYTVQFLCALMGVNRSGYYKWQQRKGKPNRYEHNRQLLTQLLQEVHSRYPSYGYHRLAVILRCQTGWSFSDKLAHKCCKQAGIRSVLRRPKYVNSGVEHNTYPNMVKGNWNAKRPLELVVSDMTRLRHKGKWYEWVYILDTFNNEILCHHLARRMGGTKPYFKCLDDLKQRMQEHSDPVILYTDQGSVYASRAFAKAHQQYTLLRSMSRVGTPTDNPIIEAINGWIKQEMYWDFKLHRCNDLQATLNDFVYYYNSSRPAFALNYKSPVQFKSEQGF